MLMKILERKESGGEGKMTGFKRNGAKLAFYWRMEGTNASFNDPS